MPMNPRLLRPTQNQHPEAADWANRVRTNGGTVSGSTLLAVSRFCRAIDAAGIRDRFFRLNLFAGTGLNAALVPLYRGPTRTGTQFGNTTDTNVGGLFVSGDYDQAIGLSTQLNGTKYLNTGLQTAAMPQGVIDSGHMSVWHGPIAQGGNVDHRFMGAHNSATANRATLAQNVYATPVGPQVEWGRTTVVTGTASPTANLASAFILGQRTSSTNLEVWRNDSVIGTNTASTTGISGIPHDIFVFRWNATGTVSGSNIAGSQRHYSIGDDMTSGQVLAFRSALLAFNTSMGRTA